MKKLFNYLIVSFFFVILCKSCIASELVTYGSKNIDFFRLNLDNGNRTNIPCSVTHLQLAFAPNGTLYATSRNTDRLYRFTDPSIGALEYLANIPVNCVGGDSTVSPNGEGFYFTAGWTSKDLFKYDIDGEFLVSLGEISGADSDLYGLAFSPDGILYGTTGTSNGQRRLYTIDLDTLQATVIGPPYFGLGIDFTGCALDFAPDGTLYTEINGFLATIDPHNGIANIDYNIYTGKIDSIAIIPEPATLALLVLGGLLIKRKL